MALLNVPITLQVQTTSSGLLFDVCNRLIHLTALIGLATERAPQPFTTTVAPTQSQQDLRDATLLYATAVFENLVNLCGQTALALDEGRIKVEGSKANLSQAEIQFLQSSSIHNEYPLRVVSILAHLLGEENALEDDRRFRERLAQLLRWRNELYQPRIAIHDAVVSEHVLTAKEIHWAGQTVVWYLAAMLSLSIFQNDVNYSALIQLTVPLFLLAREERDVVEEAKNIPWSPSAREAWRPIARQLEVNLNAMQD